MTKRAFALVMALILLGGLVPALASAKSVRDLEYAYLTAPSDYLTVGQPMTWQVVLPEGAGPFTYEWGLFSRETPVAEKLDPVTRTKKGDKDSFTHTVDKPGYYVVYCWISDADYYSVELRSEPYVAVSLADSEDTAMPVGKAKAVAAEMQKQNLTTEYDKALWLHDWLIYNADYDETKTIHEAAGVLCGGSGVCESYALAYQLLLGEVGIDSLYITGYAGGELHAWNMVKIDGEWTHVDATWDDPVGGGQETHGYFGLPDELLARDHDWDRQNFRFPKATTLAHYYPIKNGAVAFDSEEDMKVKLTEAMTEKKPVIDYVYVGTERFFDAAYSLSQWLRTAQRLLFLDGYQTSGGKFTGQLTPVYGDFEGYKTFKTDEELGQVIEAAMKDKEGLIKVYYMGDDNYYLISSPLRRWLEDNYQSLGVDSYTYQYWDTRAEITVSYK